MRGIIEGFEEEFAIVEIKGQIMNVPINLVSPEARVNDVVELIGDVWIPDKIKSKQRTIAIQGLMDELWEDK